MIDQANNHFISDHDESDDQELIANVEMLIKENKISRSGVANILQSLGAPKPASSASIRKILINFFNSAPPEKLNKFVDILHSSSQNDAFLAGISATRK